MNVSPKAVSPTLIVSVSLKANFISFRICMRFNRGTKSHVTPLRFLILSSVGYVHNDDDD